MLGLFASSAVQNVQHCNSVLLAYILLTKLQFLSTNTWTRDQEYMSHVRNNRHVSIIDSGLEAGAGVEAGGGAGGGAAKEGRRVGAHLPPQNPKSLWYILNSAMCRFL